MSEFTPGRWEVRGDGVLVGTPYKDAYWIYPVGSHAKADARLIAAAPEMYKALKQMCEAVNRMSDPNEAGECFDLLPICDAALAKADGQ